MQTLIDGIRVETASRTDERGESVPCRPGLDELEQRYRNARVRLLNAQEEKTWAAAEFIAARTALHQILEAIWPDRGDG